MKTLLLLLIAYSVSFLYPAPFRVTAPVTVSVTAPSVVLTAPATGFVDEVLLIDARQSVGVSNFPQSDSTPSVIVDYGDGFTANLLASGHRYERPGTYTITLTGKDATGNAATAQRTITITEIPPATAANRQVISDSGNAGTNGAALQAAINRAVANSNSGEQEIELKANVPHTAITLPSNSGKYITLTTSDSLPDQRFNPLTDGQRAAIILASTATNTPAVQTPSQAPDVPPARYRLRGIRLKKDDETKPLAVLMNIGTDGSGGQDRVSKLANHFIIDRCWFDGGASDTSEITNGLRVYANYVSVVDSYLGDFRRIGVGVDAAAISVSTGQGPLAFVNNAMVATTENFNIAGGSADFAENSATISSATTSSATLSRIGSLQVDQNIALSVGGSYHARHTTIVRSISGNNITFDPLSTAPDNGSVAKWQATPSFIEFRRNYLYKPLKWWPKHPSWNKINYQLKNHWETKFSRYVVIDGNQFENQWISAQLYSVVFTVRASTGGESPAAVVRQVQFTNNIIKNAANGIVVSQTDDGDTPERVSQKASDITVRNNLLWNVGANWDSSCCTHMMINLLGGPNPLKRIFVIHNTQDSGLPDSNGAHITDLGESGGALESMWFNNVHPHGLGGFRDNFTGGVAPDIAATIRRFLPPGDATSWSKNLIVNKGSAVYPPSGIYVTGSWPAQFVNHSAGDFTLVAGSPGRLAGTDGRDVGVDMAQLRAATAGTVSGIWGPQPSPTPTPVPSPTVTPTPTPVPTPQPSPSPSPSPISEFGRFAIPRTASNSNPVEIRNLLNGPEVGEAGFNQCYVVVNVTYFRCLRSSESLIVFEWKDWPWINGNAERDALTMQVRQAGYGNIFIWAGMLWASKPK